MRTSAIALAVQRLGVVPYSNAITVPFYERGKNVSRPVKGRGKALIKCKRNNYDFFPQNPELSAGALASKGWIRSKSIGDYFTINPRTTCRKFFDDRCFDFHSLGVHDNLTKALNAIGITAPSVIQAKVIPRVLQKKNLLITSTAGTGKTLSYLLPMIQNILSKADSIKLPNSPKAVIISPTKELAWQLSKVLNDITSSLPIKHKVVTGGSIKRKILGLEALDFDILIGSHGALSKFISAKAFNFSQLETIVFEEVDMLFGKDFSDQIKYILRRMLTEYDSENTTSKQLIFVSGLLPPNLLNIIQSEYTIDDPSDTSEDYVNHLLPHVKHAFYRMNKLEKSNRLLELLRQDNNRNVIIFSNKHQTSFWLSKFLEENGIKNICMNAYFNKNARQEEFEKYLLKKEAIVSCTDLISRGIDTLEMDTLVNYDFPNGIVNYINRSGRVGRSSKSTGNVIHNFVSSKTEVPLVQELEKAIRLCVFRHHPDITDIIESVN